MRTPDNKQFALRRAFARLGRRNMGDGDPRIWVGGTPALTRGRRELRTLADSAEAVRVQEILLRGVPSLSGCGMTKPGIDSKISARVRFSLIRYVLASVGGAGIGLVLAFGGSLRAQAEQGSSALQDLAPAMRVLLPALAGAVGGVVFASLHRLRDSGLVGFYTGWAISFWAGFTAFVLPEVIETGEWSGLLIGTVLGLGGGLGSALFWRQLSAKPE